MNQKSENERYFVPVVVDSVGTEFNIGTFVDELLKRKLLLLSVIAVCVLAAALVALISKKTYRAETLLAPVNSEQSVGSFAGLPTQVGNVSRLIGLPLGGDSNNAEGVAILLSREFLYDFIVAEDLLPVLFEERWDDDKNQWRQEEEPPSLEDGYRQLTENAISVSENERTGLITVAVETIDPARSADWANKLVSRINQRARDRAIQNGRKSLSFLHDELDKTSTVELRQTIYQLMESQTSRIMYANVTDEYSFKVIDPAFEPDVDNYVWPKPFALLLVGGIAGVVLGVFLVSCLLLFRREPVAQESTAS